MKKSLYRILFFCILLTVGSSLAMEQAPQQTNDITLIGPDGQRFIVPASFAQEAKTLEVLTTNLTLEEQTREIPFRDIDSNILKYVAAIAKAADRHKDLKDRALLDAIEKEINSAQLPLIELLKAFDLLDYKIGIDLIARKIAVNKAILNQLMAIQGFDHLKQTIAHFYHLLKQSNLPEIDSESYGFSIQDYLDYLPNILTTRIVEQKADFTKLRINDLYGLTNLAQQYQLQRLDLSYNKIRKIPANIWQGLAQLRILLLTGNLIREVPVDAWRGLAQLQWLDLSRNLISEIVANAWQGLAQLQELYLSRNQIRKISANAWQGLAKLENLFLVDNQITEIPKWQGLTQLKALSLSRNLISEILANAWQGLAQLQTLSLTDNQIRKFSTNAWQGFVQLQELYLSKNLISDADQTIIRNALPGATIYFE